MKDYSNDVVEKLQEAINANKFNMKHIETPEDMPKSFYFNGVHIDLLNGPVKDVVLTEDFTFDSDNMKEWKKCSLGKFVRKDWKKINKGIENYKKYIEVIFDFEDLSVVGLLRNIDKEELSNSIINENGEEENEFDIYNDLVIDGNSYSIIKLYVNGLEEYTSKSHFDEASFTEKLITNYGSYIKDEDEDDIVELKDATDVIDEPGSSIELF